MAVNRTTLILKVKKDNTWFVCNRNSDDFDNIFKDKYVKFWEVTKPDDLKFSNCDICNILTELPYDNFNKRHQKLINPVKQTFIECLNCDNTELSNKQFNNIKNTYRHIYYNQYKEFIRIKNNIEDIEEKVYNYAKKIFYSKPKLKKYYYWSYDYIWHNTVFNDEQKVILIILRNHLLRRSTDLSYHPFEKGYIKKTIKYLIEKYDDL